MEILFKDYEMFFFIKDDNLDYYLIKDYPNINLTNIKHLDDVKILYHYRTPDDFIYPVYYEYNGICITKGKLGYFCHFALDIHIKDYTLVNLKLL